jgi:hypothetical protein
MMRNFLNTWITSFKLRKWSRSAGCRDGLRRVQAGRQPRRLQLRLAHPTTSERESFDHDWLLLFRRLHAGRRASRAGGALNANCALIALTGPGYYS